MASVPHLYISALSWAPSSTILRELLEDVRDKLGAPVGYHGGWKSEALEDVVVIEFGCG